MSLIYALASTSIRNSPVQSPMHRQAVSGAAKDPPTRVVNHNVPLPRAVMSSIECDRESGEQSVEGLVDEA